MNVKSFMPIRILLNSYNYQTLTEVIGKRPGEAVNCVHSQGEGGCGTTQFCSKCGAVNAILESHNDKQSIKECRIMTVDNDALDFMIIASPYWINDEMFTLFALSDISDEKRRLILEKTFFHDVLNTAGGISGLSDVLQYVEDADEQKELLKIIHNSSDSLVDEIKSQRQLNEAERGTLELEFSEILVLNILQELSELYSRHQIIEKRKIQIENISPDLICFTDKVLLKRVLGNMIKNALEASPTDGIVTISSFKKTDSVLFSVHNSSFMKKDIQLQLFKRSFSTKGSGRGIGTYSIKLFGEKYLKGKVWFESYKENGTTFFLEIPDQFKKISHNPDWS
jgi:signal transduction histidine kinase